MYLATEFVCHLIEGGCELLEFVSGFYVDAVIKVSETDLLDSFAKSVEGVGYGECDLDAS